MGVAGLSTWLLVIDQCVIWSPAPEINCSLTKYLKYTQEKLVVVYDTKAACFINDTFTTKNNNCTFCILCKFKFCIFLFMRKFPANN